MWKPPNICIYCEQAGSTREHYFGQHADKLFPREGGTTRQIARGPAHGLQLGEEVTLSQRQGSLRKGVIKRVCGRCNKSWMREIHERAWPVIKPLSDGKWWDLDAGERESLSSYITLLAMSYEFVNDTTVATRQLERTWFMGHGRPPSNWMVGIGEHTGGNWEDAISHFGGRIGDRILPFQCIERPRDFPPMTIQQTVAALGGLLFCAISESDEELSSIGVLPEQIMEQHKLQIIWPPHRSVVAITKPSHLHTQAEIDSLANELYARFSILMPNWNRP